MTISNGLLCELLKGCKRPKDLLGKAGLMKELKIRLMERMLGAELTAHLGYEAGAAPRPERTNRRNGVATKFMKGSDGVVPLSVPRDREGSFEPELVKKGQTRIDRVDDKIIGLYAAGLSVHDIRAHLEGLYGQRVSPDLISRVTDAAPDEVHKWQNRAPELRHFVPDLIRAHAMIYFLTLVLYRVLRMRLKAKGHSASPHTALDLLERIQQHVTRIGPTAKTTLTRQQPEQLDLFEALDLKTPA